jgi:hypothetical protein
MIICLLHLVPHVKTQATFIQIEASQPDTGKTGCDVIVSMRAPFPSGHLTGYYIIYTFAFRLSTKLNQHNSKQSRVILEKLTVAQVAASCLLCNFVGSLPRSQVSAR